jgi:hypothetical protein
MIFIVEVSDKDVDCWSRETEADIVRVHNMVAQIFGREPAATFEGALAGLSAMEKPREIRVYRGLEEASAAALVEANPQVRYCLDTEIGIVRRAMARV